MTYSGFQLFESRLTSVLLSVFRGVDAKEGINTRDFSQTLLWKVKCGRQKVKGSLSPLVLGQREGRKDRWESFRPSTVPRKLLAGLWGVYEQGLPDGRVPCWMVWACTSTFVVIHQWLGRAQVSAFSWRLWISYTLRSRLPQTRHEWSTSMATRAHIKIFLHPVLFIILELSLPYVMSWLPLLLDF